jgi:hypothetical protein
MTEMITGYEYGLGDNLILNIRPCPSCRQPHQLIVNVYAFEKWVDGILSLEKAFPDLPPAERELLLTGIDGTCFKNMPKEEDEEDYPGANEIARRDALGDLDQHLEGEVESETRPPAQAPAPDPQQPLQAEEKEQEPAQPDA